jgi:hypothetical protein
MTFSNLLNRFSDKGGVGEGVVGDSIDRTMFGGLGGGGYWPFQPPQHQQPHSPMGHMGPMGPMGGGYYVPMQPDPNNQYNVKLGHGGETLSSGYSSGSGYGGGGGYSNSYSPPQTGGGYGYGYGGGHQPRPHPVVYETPRKSGKGKGAALSALTLLAFLFFLNLLQSCLKEHMDGMNPTVSESRPLFERFFNFIPFKVMVMTAGSARNRAPPPNDDYVIEKTFSDEVYEDEPLPKNRTKVHRSKHSRTTIAPKLQNYLSKYSEKLHDFDE